ncbi:unnamed protein product, partial [Arabidopsis halleri]
WTLINQSRGFVNLKRVERYIKKLNQEVSMEQVRVSYRLVLTMTCLVCSGFSVGMCSESDPLIKTYVSSSLLSDNGLVYSVQSISGSEWDSLVIQSKISVMVLFTAENCLECNSVHEIMLELDLIYGDRFKFYTIDVDKEKDIGARYAYDLPTTIVFKDGKEKDRVTGVQPEILRELVLQYM